MYIYIIVLYDLNFLSRFWNTLHEFSLSRFQRIWFRGWRSDFHPYSIPDVTTFRLGTLRANGSFGRIRFASIASYQNGIYDFLFHLLDSSANPCSSSVFEGLKKHSVVSECTSTNNFHQKMWTSSLYCYLHLESTIVPELHNFILETGHN